jgi:hypothetical protein
MKDHVVKVHGPDTKAARKKIVLLFQHPQPPIVPVRFFKCAECGEPAATNHPRTLYCQPRCRWRAQKKAHRTKRRAFQAQSLPRLPGFFGG